MVVVVVVVFFSSLARILGECSTIHSLPALFIVSIIIISSRTLIPLLYARISPQWLSELRRLWSSVPRQVACELVSGYVLTLCLNSGVVSVTNVARASVVHQTAACFPAGEDCRTTFDISLPACALV